ncbi:MAG: hypothetical protein P8177_12680, partial [Gemmatimonadota bacterium]
MFNRLSLPTVAIGLVVAAGCSDGSPTDLAPLGPDGPEAARSPGQLTAGQIPTTLNRTGVYDGAICGIPTLVEFHEAGTEWEAPFGPPIRETGTLVTTWTNPANQQWVEFRNSGQVTRENLEFYSDGSFKVREVFKHGVKLSSENGPPLTLADLERAVAVEFQVLPRHLARVPELHPLLVR